ncbi:MAG: ribonuclease T2 [Rhodobacterales bacterium]|nr:ribonuclease T2 [Rhodobacterales bacterium]
MIRALLALFLMFPAIARAEDVAGVFDYYVLSLSWSPNWCALEGDDRASPQCDDGAGFGWVLHGLWPQYDNGYPQDCRTGFATPTRQQTEGIADIMGTSGLAWHQWNKHGVCSGLSPSGFFALARLAYDRVVRPDVFMRLPDEVELPASVVEEAFVKENPGLRPDGITVTCKSGMIQEARICLTRDLEFRRCGADVIRDCTLDDALFEPVR